ncbi:unnamed protein product [[Actinomadura] parvosata subsp. kistnae]|uniref:Chromosome segregation ATPase n=1 Tax=[Actinomadura] parvosata subsp. kistnae TaxID=1909395 RepID=A0A1V0AGV7_9ACTN|nr:hypothetical protein [Nonomuraea sp. ATCC 55076]AQZ69436.1 hypothetical protein BKM31_55315 [Nonomuraea sp. ATCC 55076]SPL91919.1 unnamed protein product [Actinomadura parvosata subsp. kistnae]
MTYQLSRLRLANVGDRAARFTDLTLDVSSDADGSREPVDSILWLRNGGGKSSLLSLFFALLLPLRKDFMGKSVKRYLEDYIASGDTSHTVAEWIAQSDDSLLPPPRLITGALYEWIDRRKPVDPDRDREKLRGWYYSFFEVPGVLDLDHLPVHDETGRTRPMAEFVRLLREIAASRPQQFSFAITDQRGVWTETLIARNVDPILFGYQKEMNHSEGGVAELFNFPSTDKFIDFLIDLTVDSAQPELVAANLRKVIDVLGRKPDLLVDRDFCAEMSGILDTLAERHHLANEADREAGEAKQAAALLAAAFQSAASAQETDREWFAGEAKRLRGEAHRLDSERGRLNDVANELLRIAATYRLAAVTKAAEEAKSAATATKNDDLAWEAVGPLAERAEAEDQARSVRRQMTETERETAPLRRARDDAAALLKARYAALAADERTAEEQMTSAAETARSHAATEEERVRVNRELSAKAEERADNLRLQMASIEEAIETAANLGDLPDREAVPAEVLGDSRAAKNEANQLLNEVRARRAGRPALRTSLSEQRRALATERAARNSERDQLVSDHEKLSARVSMLATNARFAELMELSEDGRLDLWAEAANLRAALTHAVSTAESVIVETRVDAADDDRALDGLRTDAFLPTTRDAQRVAEAIAGEVTAQPGWELLRDLVSEPARAVALRNSIVAELAAGVVVADADLGKAHLALEKQGCWSIAHVTVCSATQMQQALNAAAPEWSAVPSDPALYDPAAAEHARAERERRRHEQERRIAELHEQTQADRTLLEVLESLLRDCPTGYLHTLEIRAEECRQAIDMIDSTDATLGSQIDELEAHDLADAATEQRLSDNLNLLASRIERLTALVAKVSTLQELKRDIEQRDRDVRAYTRVADEATTLANEWRKTERAAEREAAEHRSNKERYEREGRAISMLDAGRKDVATPTDDPLSMLTSRFNDLDIQWHAVAAQSVLAERLTGLISRAERAEQALVGYPEAIRERAASLLETGDGQDPERRAIARRRSREKADQAQQGLSRAILQLEQARKEVTERTPRDRLRHAQLDVEPAGEAEARELAAIQAATATDMSGQVTALNREADDAVSAASEADTAAQVLAQRAHRLTDTAAPADVVDGVAAFDGDDARAESETRAVLGRLASTAEIVTVARIKTNEAIDAVRRLASEGRFSGIPDAIRDRFTGDDPETLGERAAVRAEEMRARRTTIDGQLADIGRDQRLVVVEIAALVQDVLANLESANRHSKLPGTLGGWADQHFLRIRFARPSSEEDLHARIDAVVDRIVVEKSKPEGFALLKRCVHEAVAPRGFTVKVLKPNSDLAVEPVDVTRLGKFSGGEKLTVCVALYCTLARLRAVNRGRGRAALGGTLVLDNPLGTASHVALLRLQREVATAHGVQLIYTTGVEDLGAVGQFPNVLRMRNAPGTLRTRRYVVLEERFGSAVEGITGVRLTRDETTDGAAS